MKLYENNHINNKLNTSSIWNDYEREDFNLNGRNGLIVKPKKVMEGVPWIWRAEFFDAFSFADMELLKKGWHIAYYSVCNMYGCDESLNAMKKFRDYIVEEYHLSHKCAIFGFSRGALYAVNYAAKYLQDVFVIYLDAPVLNILSWPGGKGIGVGSQSDWIECLSKYGLDEESVKSYTGNPLDKAGIIVMEQIPVIVVAGDADDDVPFIENGNIFVEDIKKLGGKVKLILKSGVGHHPHSLENPQEIVEFIMENYKN
jgi:hypothetical protein